MASGSGQNTSTASSSTSNHQAQHGLQLGNYNTFGIEAQASMTNTFAEMLNQNLVAVLPNAIQSIYSTLLNSFQGTISQTVASALDSTSFDTCVNVDKIYGFRCTHPRVRDRKTGKLSRYCRGHKYTGEKKDSILFLDSLIHEQPNLIKRKKEFERQRGNRTNTVKQSRNRTPVIETRPSTRANSPASPENNENNNSNSGSPRTVGMDIDIINTPKEKPVR